MQNNLNLYDSAVYGLAFTPIFFKVAGTDIPFDKAKLLLMISAMDLILNHCVNKHPQAYERLMRNTVLSIGFALSSLLCNNEDFVPALGMALMTYCLTEMLPKGHRNDEPEKTSALKSL